jgi:Tol biopolymer transport system component
MRKKIILSTILLALLSFISCSNPSGAAPPTSIPFLIPQSTPATRIAPTPVIPAREPADLGLTGKLLYVQGKAGIALFDLENGTIDMLFEPPTDGQVSAASISPDGKWIVMSYSPPPEPDKPQLGYTRLFIMPADGSAEPQPLLDPADETGLLYTLPTWSPDGRSITFGTFSPKDAGDDATGFSIQRIDYPDGHPQRLLDNGFQPRLSPDGAKLAYVGLTDPTTPINQLFVANADGSDPAKLVPLDDTLWTIDAPVFSRDSTRLIFSGVNNQPKTSTTWLDEWFGVHVARAHNIPSDLFEVPLSGGEPTRLALLGDIGLYTDTSPDGAHIAYLSLGGITVMDPDGSNLARISILGGVGTLQWIP